MTIFRYLKESAIYCNAIHHCIGIKIVLRKSKKSWEVQDLSWVSFSRAPITQATTIWRIRSALNSCNRFLLTMNHFNQFVMSVSPMAYLRWMWFWDILIYMKFNLWLFFDVSNKFRTNASRFIAILLKNIWCFYDKSLWKYNAYNESNLIFNGNDHSLQGLEIHNRWSYSRRDIRV